LTRNVDSNLDDLKNPFEAKNALKRTFQNYSPQRHRSPTVGHGQKLQSPDSAQEAATMASASGAGRDVSDRIQAARKV